MSILNIKNLVKSYKGQLVINNISLKVKSGEIIGLLGPNGAGKTTTFYIILGIINCNSGCITIDNTDISMLPLYKRARLGIGYLPQEASIFRRLSVFNNIMSILEIRHDLNHTQRHTRANELMQEFHIDHLRNHIGSSLSGGERRRVEIARALSANPKFMLLDEPFAGIDPISIIDIKQTIKYLCNSGLGILITDHNVRETLDICTRAYIVNKGIIIAQGIPESILLNKEVKQTYLGETFHL